MSEKIHENVREAIAEADKEFMRLYRLGDAAGVAALYSEDPVLMPPNMDFVRGKPGVQAVFQGLMDMGIKALVFEILEVEQCADHAIEMSRYSLLGAEEQVLDQGKFIVVWKREQGHWKLHRDIFNTSQPA